MLYREIIELQMKPNERRDITKHVQDIVAKAKVHEGLCNIFFPGTTAGLLLNESDLMLLKDFERFYEQIFPKEKLYQHADNGYAHLRASLLKTSSTIPISNGKLALGRWQSILLWEFDNSPRNREIIVTVQGDQ